MGSPGYLGKKEWKIFRCLNGQEPWCSHHSNLESWYNDNIKDGSRAYRDHCTYAANYLINELTSSWSCIDEVVMGGSLGKGTILKDQSDVDLVALMDWDSIDTVGPKKYKKKLKEGQEFVENLLEGIDGVTEVWSDSFVVHFDFEYDGVDITVDLLLTADNSHDGDVREMMEAMVRKSEDNREFYSACLVKQRQQFIKSQPGYVKELIRLVKTWARAALPSKLKKSYFLELLTIRLWEEAGEPSRFDKAQGLMDVLQNLVDLRNIQTVYWVENYSDEDAKDAISEFEMKIDSPILLDPTNPMNNVCKFLEDVNLSRAFSRAARATLHTTLFEDVTVYTDWSHQ